LDLVQGELRHGTSFLRSLFRFASFSTLISSFPLSFPNQVYTRFEGASLTLSRLIKFQSSLSSQADYDDVKAFFATKDTSKFTMSLAQVSSNDELTRISDDED